MLAVLVVSCPCALSVATPAALAAAAGASAQQHIFTARGDALESLARVTHVVLDKTGTLTLGRLTLLGVEPLAQHPPSYCVAIAAALEAGGTHPIAHAVQQPVALAGTVRDTHALAQAAAPAVAVRDTVATPGNGVEGIVDGGLHRFGRPEWVAAVHGQPLPALSAAVRPAPDAITVALGDGSGWLAWFTFGDDIRPGARALVERLQAMGLTVSLLSGDRAATVRHVAQAVGVADYRGDARPEASAPESWHCSAAARGWRWWATGSTMRRASRRRTCRCRSGARRR